MINNFNDEFRILFRNIYHAPNIEILYNIELFFNCVLKNKNLILTHVHKKNIKKNICNEITRIKNMYYFNDIFLNDIKNIFIDNEEYDIL